MVISGHQNEAYEHKYEMCTSILITYFFHTNCIRIHISQKHVFYPWRGKIMLISSIFNQNKAYGHEKLTLSSNDWES